MTVFARTSLEQKAEVGLIIFNNLLFLLLLNPRRSAVGTSPLWSSVLPPPSVFRLNDALSSRRALTLYESLCCEWTQSLSCKLLLISQRLICVWSSFLQDSSRGSCSIESLTMQRCILRKIIENGYLETLYKSMQVDCLFRITPVWVLTCQISSSHAVFVLNRPITLRHVHISHHVFAKLPKFERQTQPNCQTAATQSGLCLICILCLCSQTFNLLLQYYQRQCTQVGSTTKRTLHSIMRCKKVCACWFWKPQRNSIINRWVIEWW